MRHFWACVIFGALTVIGSGSSRDFCTLAAAAEPVPFGELGRQYDTLVRPLLARVCLDCHGGDEPKGELNLRQFGRLDEARRAIGIWQKVAEMLDNGEMPPKDSDQPTSDERKQLQQWIAQFLNAEAHANAGDPGPVVLRRLSNAQYTYTIRDITAVALDPLREFPLDGAAGEGFTNTGNALVMSPALLSKYLDAGKQIAAHAVLVKDGFHFSSSTTRRDWTNEILAQIRQIYLRHSDSQTATKVNLHGLTWESNDAGRLPIEKYLAATLALRDNSASGREAIDKIAAERQLNPRYLAALWDMLHGSEPSPLLDHVRASWRAADANGAEAIATQIANWQRALTRFQSVGHMKSWMVPVNPVTVRQEFRQKLPATAGATVTLYLATGTAGDGATGDHVTWHQPRLVAPGRPDLPLRGLREFIDQLNQSRKQIFADATASLAAVDEVRQSDKEFDVVELAKRHNVNAAALSAWLDYFGVGPASAVRLDHFTQRIPNSAGYDFVKGWGTSETPSLMANSSDQHVRIPGNMKPHGVVVHPSPTLATAIGWQCPAADRVRIEGKVTHAHPECGNGITWTVELRRGNTRQVLASGVSAGAVPQVFGPLEPQTVRAGDLVSLAIGPRDGNHACDLTDVELQVTSEKEASRVWNLSADVTPDVLASNPHADRYGNPSVWHFYTEATAATDRGPAVPAGSILARWHTAEPAERTKLAGELQQLLTGGPPVDSKRPDAVLYRQLASLGGPLLARARSQRTPANEQPSTTPGQGQWGLDSAIFGRQADGKAIDPLSLSIQAPAVIEVRLPADLAEGYELSTAATLEAGAGEGSVQPLILAEKPADTSKLLSDAPILVAEGSPSRARFEAACDEFRRWFPAALCYLRIVPVDEAVTLTLYHREDEPLSRLMLDESQRAQLDRLWDDLHFVSHDALTLVDAFNQLMEYATQDSDPKLFEPFRKPIHDSANAFRQALIDAELRQVESLVNFAQRAYRRPLGDAERAELRAVYAQLRKQELSHDEAFRFTLARVFTSPDFLYRWEEAPPGKAAGPVSDVELANRLSYFLWSSCPDAALSEASAGGQLHQPDALVAQSRRMLADPRIKRLAEEFACQWLHIYDLPTLDEKSERHFPTFLQLRGAMHEEAVRFFTDLFQRDGSVLEIYNADHTFVNEALAQHYQIPGVTGTEWQRIDGAGRYGRGGVLAMAATLSKQSGASRTSPILRGNWVSEVLLGERLPRPPKDVPLLPDDEAATAELTVRQLVEKHTSDARCTVCHKRIDPLGFALEGFDAIGRRRAVDLAGRKIDVLTSLPDGTQLLGLEGLREYLLTKRRDAVLRQFNRKLLGFALGRGVQLSDEPLLESMRTALETHEFRISALIETIVRSRQFREIRGHDAQFADAP